MHKIKLILLLILPLSVLGQDLGIIDTKTTKNPAINGTHRISTDGQNLFFRNFFGVSKKIANTDSPTFTGNVKISSLGTGDYVKVGLNGLLYSDNTFASDALSATQSALDLKANIASPTFTGNVTLPNSVRVGGTISSENNTYLGKNALPVTNSFGVGNTAIGSNSSALIQNGNFNTSVGYISLGNSVNGTSNTAIGVNSLGQNTTGSNNTGIGLGAGRWNTTGANNTYLGYETGNGITTGSGNTVVGASITGWDDMANYVLIGSGGKARLVLDGTGKITLTGYYRNSNALLRLNTFGEVVKDSSFAPLASPTFTGVVKVNSGVNNVEIDQTQIMFRRTNGTTMTLGNYRAYGHYFFTGSTYAGLTEAMSINNYGQVNIGNQVLDGIVSPTVKFQVGATAEARQRIISQASNATIELNGATGGNISNTTGNLNYTSVGNHIFNSKVILPDSTIIGNISSTELSYLDGVTSSIQTQLGNKQNQLNGTGFLKATGTTISYDNSTYLSTTSASSTYLPIANPTSTGTLTAPTIANSLGANFATSSGSITVGNITAQTGALIGARRAGNSFEFGHSNQAGYQSTLGANAGNGHSFLALNSEAGTTNNTFRTRGLAGRVIVNNVDFNRLDFQRVTSASADNQTPVIDLSIFSTGRVGINTTTDAGFLLDVNGTAKFSNNVSIGTTSPNASSILDITSTTKGVLFPRMTTTEISAISSPADGLMVYNTTLKAICFYDAGAAVWKRVSHSNM